MRDGDALENNPEVSRSALEAIHSQVFGWALSRCYYDQAAAADQYAATLAKWFGIDDVDLDVVAPNINNFAARDLGFML